MAICPTKMARFLSVVVAVCSRLADAKVHTIQHVPVNGTGVVILKTLYVDASRNSASIDIIEFVCVSNSSGQSFGSLGIAPVDVEFKKFLSCDENGPVKVGMTPGVYMSKSAKCGIFGSHRTALDHSGIYAVYVAYCSTSNSPATISVKISGGKIHAHESGWAMIFFVFVVFHVVLCAFWAVYKQNSGESVDSVVQEIFFASVLVVVSHSFGFVLHLLPDTPELAQTAHIGLWSLTVSSVMTALISASGIGGSTPSSWFLTFFCCVMTFVFFIGLVDYTLLFERYASYRRNAPGKPALETNVLWVVGSVCVFGFTCVHHLASSLRAFNQKGLQQELAGCRMLAAVVAIYISLVFFSAVCIYHDVPNDANNRWAFHCLAGAVSTQVTQSFGLGATMLIFWKTKFDAQCDFVRVANKEDEERAIIGHTDSKKVDCDDEVPCSAINPAE